MKRLRNYYIRGEEINIGRPVKNTYYRETFAGKRLSEHLRKNNNAIELSNLYELFISTAEEERNNRLLNNSDIVKQLVKFINVIENKVTVDTDIVDIIMYKDLYFKIKDKIRSLENQGKGGIRASATRKANKEKTVYSDWIELPIHGFSTNFLYSVGKRGKMVRSEAYATWREKFPHELIPSSLSLWSMGVDIDKPLGIEAQFVAKEKFDVDNFSKSLIDAIFENFGDDDNLVQETKCTRIGTCEHYSEGLIRFRLYNI